MPLPPPPPSSPGFFLRGPARDSNGFTDRIDLGTIVLMDRQARLVLFGDGSRTCIPDPADFQAMLDEMGHIGVGVATTGRFVIRCDAIVRIAADLSVVHLAAPGRPFPLGDRADAEALIATLVCDKPARFGRAADGACVPLAPDAPGPTTGHPGPRARGSSAPAAGFRRAAPP